MIPHLGFHAARVFHTARAFSLEPLRRFGAGAFLTGAIEGIQSISLRRLSLKLGGPENERVVLEADGDLFKALKRRGREIPSGPIILRADCVVLPDKAAPVRRVTFVPPDTVILENENDEAIASQVLERGGFHDSIQ